MFTWQGRGLELEKVQPESNQGEPSFQALVGIEEEEVIIHLAHLRPVDVAVTGGGDHVAAGGVLADLGHLAHA